MRIQTKAIQLAIAGSAFVALGVSADFSQFDTVAKAADARAKEAMAADPTLREIPNRVLVRFSADATDQDRAEARRAVGCLASSAFTIVPGLERLDTAVSVTDAMARLQGLDGIEYVEPDFVVRADAIPNDEYYEYLWGMENARAPQAWDTRTDGSGVVVAVIDTGVAWDHPDLQNQIWINPGEGPNVDGIDNDGNGIVDDIVGFDYYDYDIYPYDEQGHGTHCAGTIGAEGNNGFGVAGVSWNAQIMIMRFLGPDGGGQTSDAIYCIQYAAFMGAKISNNSWGGGGFSQALEDALAYARSQGHLAICAAGNESNNNDQNPSFPASIGLDNVLSVAAIDLNDNIADFSNFGRTSVDIAAPGVDILSTIPGGFDFLSGTSMATPHVSGLAALVWSHHPDWTYTQVRNAILNTARPIAALNGLCATGGTIDAAAALDYAGGGGGNERPAAPANFRASPRSHSVVLTWTDMSDNEERFEIQRQKKNSKGRWKRNGKGSVGADVEEAEWTNTSSGQYRYRIRARNAAGRSRWSEWVEATVN